MAAFEYKALDVRGRQKKGIIEGDSVRQVSQQIKEQGLIPVEIKKTEMKKQRSSKKSTHSSMRGLKVSELALIIRQLATLVQSGMPLEECLKAVAEQTEKIRVKNMLVSVRARVVEGFTLADSFADYPNVFDQLFRSMIAAGERSGHLDVILERLADYEEKRQKVRSQLQQAMVYPTMLVLFAIAIVSFLLAAVVPKMIDQFVVMGQELPQSTRILLAMSDFVQNYGQFVLLIALSFAYMVKMLLKRPAIRLSWDQKIINMPVIGKISRGLNTSRFARTLSICTSSTIPILDGMKVAGEVMGNEFIKKQVLIATEKVREGSTLRQSLQQTKLFPPMMLYMIASGEQSGELESMLTRASDTQDQNFESTVNIALGIFTPVLVVIMAGLVLFIVMATLMPILEMNNLMTR